MPYMVDMSHNLSAWAKYNPNITKGIQRSSSCSSSSSSCPWLLKSSASQVSCRFPTCISLPEKLPATSIPFSPNNDAHLKHLCESTMNFSINSSASQTWSKCNPNITIGIQRGASSSCSWLLKSSASQVLRLSRCMSFPATLPPTSIPFFPYNKAPLQHLPESLYIPLGDDDDTRIMQLVETTRAELRITKSKPVETMKLIDTLQRLGIAYHFEEDISALLDNFSEGRPDDDDDDDIFTVSLRFRLLRQNGHHIGEDVLRKFTDERGKFKESIREDNVGLLSLYESSYLGTTGEELLSQAMEFTRHNLKKSKQGMAPQLRRQVSESLELPRHLRMERLESKKYIEEYGKERNHCWALLELAKLDYNKVQSLHQMEFAEISRWWKQLGLVDKLPFARDRPLECFLWTVGILPEPKYSGCRIELAKTIAILLVIDDVYDTYAPFHELVLFTNSIQRWDLDAIEELPEYMKICYMALYNTTNQICYKVLKDHGFNTLPYLKNTWIDMIKGFMLEAEWLKNGNVPKLEEYIENGVTTAGSYMALTHIFCLIGQGVTKENLKSLVKPYPISFSCAGRILRLWDDLGTSKEEQKRGDVASSIQLFMSENNIKCENEGRKEVEQLIRNLWKELNGELIAPKGLPLPIIKACSDMARTSQVVYQHDEASYFSGVDKHVHSLFFSPIDL